MSGTDHRSERWLRPPSVTSSSLPRSFHGTSIKQRGRGLIYSLTSEPLSPVACRPQLLPLNFKSPKKSSLKLGMQSQRGFISTFAQDCLGLPISSSLKRTLIWFLSQEGDKVVFMSVSMKDLLPKPLSPCSSRVRLCQNAVLARF